MERCARAPRSTGAYSPERVADGGVRDDTELLGETPPGELLLGELLGELLLLASLMGAGRSPMLIVTAGRCTHVLAVPREIGSTMTMSLLSCSFRRGSVKRQCITQR